MAKASLLVTLLLTTLSVASPVTPNSNEHIFKRSVDDSCTQDLVGDAASGKWWARTADGQSAQSCEDAINASSTNGVACFMINDSGNYDQIKCPQDSAPTKNPDGSDTGAAGEVIKVFCDSGLSLPGLGQFISSGACLLFGYYDANGDIVAQNQAGIYAVCDAFLAGSCTFFSTVAPFLQNAPYLVKCDPDAENDPCGPLPGARV